MHIIAMIPSAYTLATLPPIGTLRLRRVDRLQFSIDIVPVCIHIYIYIYIYICIYIIAMIPSAYTIANLLPIGTLRLRRVDRLQLNIAIVPVCIHTYIYIYIYIYTL